VSYGIGDQQRTQRTTHARRAAAEDTRSYGEKRSTTPTPHRTTAERHVAPGYDRVEAELWNRRRTAHARTGHTHGRGAAAEDTTFLWEKRSARHQHCIEAPQRAALGYDHEAVSYGIGDAQRMHGQVTRTGAAQQRRTPALWENSDPTLHRSTAEAALGYDHEAGAME
jgi:hypothetical protein